MTAAAPTRAPTTPPVAKARATWYTVSAGNDVYFRAGAPAAAVGGRVALIPEADVEEILGGPNRSESLPWTLVAATPAGRRCRVTSAQAWRDFVERHPKLLSLHAEFPKHEGTAVFSRPDLFSRATLALSMRDQGIRVVTETDDNYLAAPQHNIVMRRQSSPVEQRRHALAMASGDAMVFSTAALRDSYTARIRPLVGKRNMPPSFVCRNHVPRSDWPTRDEGEGALRVGFMGSMSHVWDINLAYASFAAAKDLGCETLTIGYNPGDPDPDVPDTVETEHEWGAEMPHEDGRECKRCGLRVSNTEFASGKYGGKLPPCSFSWRSEKSIAAKETWAKVIDRAIRWIEPDEYHRAALPLDIGLCPLRTDEFTLGKSDIKAVEYTISGAAVVCSNNPVYNTEGWKHEVNCLMAGSAREMAEQTIRLVKDRKLRYELVTAAQDYVWNHRNEDMLRAEWGEALDG